MTNRADLYGNDVSGAQVILVLILVLFTGPHILIVCCNIIVLVFRYSRLFLPTPVDLHCIVSCPTLTGGSQFSVPILFSPDEFPFRGDKLSP